MTRYLAVKLDAVSSAQSSVWQMAYSVIIRGKRREREPCTAADRTVCGALH
jgi:hypothetical protein